MLLADWLGSESLWQPTITQFPVSGLSRNGPSSANGSSPSMEPPADNSSGPGLDQATGIMSPPSSLLRFAGGLVVHVRTASEVASERTIVLDQLIPHSRWLETAILSTSVVDTSLLREKFMSHMVELHIVAHARTQSERNELLARLVGLPRTSLYTPRVEPGLAGGWQHSKLMVFFVKRRTQCGITRFMRIVVPSGNLVSTEWSDSTRVLNVAFVIDLPHLGSGSAGTTDVPFAANMLELLRAQGLPPDVLRRFEGYDFSSTRPYAFIYTLPARAGCEAWRQSGLPCLANAVRTLGLEAGSALRMDVASSSIGATTLNLLRCLYTAAQGTDPTKEASLKDMRTPPSKLDIRIYYPTKETVDQAISFGFEGAPGIYMDRQAWRSLCDIQHMFRDLKPVAAGVLSHMKFLFAEGRRSDDSPVSWAYVGSANCTAAAWGKVLTADGSDQMQLSPGTNYESGVLVSGDGLRSLAAPFDMRRVSSLAVESPIHRSNDLEYRGREPFLHPSAPVGRRR